MATFIQQFKALMYKHILYKKRNKGQLIQVHYKPTLLYVVHCILIVTICIISSVFMKWKYFSDCILNILKNQDHAGSRTILKVRHLSSI